MLSFLLLLLIIFVVIPLGSAIFKIWQMRRRMNEFMRDPFGMGAGAAGNSRHGRREEPQPARPRKKIDPSVGEYVAFTEVEVSEQSADTGTSSTNIKVEQQVVDVEWEDIPDKE